MTSKIKASRAVALIDTANELIQSARWYAAHGNPARAGSCLSAAENEIAGANELLKLKEKVRASQEQRPADLK